MTIYRPVTVHLPDGTTETVPLPERYRGADMWLTDRNPEDTRLTRPRLEARVQALHAAIQEAGALLLVQRGREGREITAELSDRYRDRVLARADKLEAWLLRSTEYSYEWPITGDDLGIVP